MRLIHNGLIGSVILGFAFGVCERANALAEGGLIATDLAQLFLVAGIIAMLSIALFLANWEAKW